MAIESYVTSEGESFKADTLALAGLLSRNGIRGSELGRLIRGEEPMPPHIDKYLLELELGVKFKGPRKVFPRAPKGPNIEKLWDALILAVKNSTKGAGRDAGDLFLQSGVDPDEFLSWLESASGDIAQSWQYAVDAKTQALWDKFSLALETGIYTQSSPFERWSLRERKQRLKDIYADYWYDEVSQGWSLILRDPKRMSGLLAIKGP